MTTKNLECWMRMLNGIERKRRPKCLAKALFAWAASAGRRLTLPAPVVLFASAIPLHAATEAPALRAPKSPEHQSGHAPLDVAFTDKAALDGQVPGFPVSVAIPLAKGAFRDTAGSRLLDAGGKAVPAQFAVLNRWWAANQSIRHLLVHFQPTVPATAAIRHFWQTWPNGLFAVFGFDGEENIGPGYYNMEGGRYYFGRYDQATRTGFEVAGSARGYLDGPFSRARFGGWDYGFYPHTAASPDGRYLYTTDRLYGKVMLRRLDFAKQEVRTLLELPG